MCYECWVSVPEHLKAAVLDTVRQRTPGQRADKTWAPWWRAQSRACHSIAPKSDMNDAKLTEALAFANRILALEPRVGYSP